MKKKVISLLGVLSAVLPSFALAQSNAFSVLGTIGSLLNKIIPVLITLGVIYFIWGIISYVFGKSDDAKKEGKSRITYGLIGLVVIVGMWGLVAIITNTLGVTGSNTSVPTLPCIPSTNITC